MYIYIYKLYLKIFLEKISLSCISIIKFKRKTLMDLIETKVQNSIIFFIKTNFIHLDNALMLGERRLAMTRTREEGREEAWNTAP